MHLSTIVGRAGDLRAGSDLLKRAVTAAETLDSKALLLEMHLQLIYVELLRSNMPVAELHVQLVLDILRKFSSQLWVPGTSWLHVVDVYLAVDRRDEAIAVFEEIRTRQAEEGSGIDPTLHKELFTLWTMGRLELHGAQHDAARGYFQHALQSRENSRPFNSADLLFDIGESWRLQGPQFMNEARTCYILSAVWNSRLGERVCLLYTLGNM